MLESFLHQGKKATYVFLCSSTVSGILERKNFHKLFLNFFKKVVKNHLKCEKKSFPPPDTPRIRIRKKNADPKPW